MTVIHRQPTVVVLGAGIIGLGCARALAMRGIAVDVVDACFDGAATQAAAGMLSPVSEADEPPSIGRIGYQSMQQWPDFASELRAESGIPITVDEEPTLVPSWARDQGDDERLGALLEAAQSLGMACEPLDADALRRRYPELAPTVERGLLLPEARVDPRQVALALAGALRQRAVPVHRYCRIAGVEVRSGSVRLLGAGFSIESQQLVLAGGAWSGQLSGLPELPIRPVRGQMIAYDGLPWELRGRIRHRHLYAVGDRTDGALLVGATVEERGFDTAVTQDGRLTLVELAHRLLPRLRWKAVSRHWCGLRPGTGDGLPILGRLQDTPVIYATGHYRNGILLTPWTASAVADCVLGADPSEREWSPQRFL